MLTSNINIEMFWKYLRVGIFFQILPNKNTRYIVKHYPATFFKQFAKKMAILGALHNVPYQGFATHSNYNLFVTVIFT